MKIISIKQKLLKYNKSNLSIKFTRKTENTENYENKCKRNNLRFGGSQYQLSDIDKNSVSQSQFLFGTKESLKELVLNSNTNESDE